LASLIYLALPVGVFLIGWLRPPWAVLFVATLLAGAGVWGRRLGRPGATPEADARAVSAPALVGAALVVLGVVALSGAGGFGLQTWDWAKHHAILRDLMEQPWPVAYATGRDDVALTYYVAYYLPAALVGTVAGWTAANVALFAWTVLGAVLALLWVVVLSGAHVWPCLGVFVLFSGLDLVGAPWSGRWSGAAWLQDFHVEWWAGPWLYPSNVTLLAFAPHQALGGWLLTALALDGLGRYAGRYPHVLGAGICLLWSPFASLGLVGLAALGGDGRRSQRGGPGGLARDPAALAGAAITLVLVLYLLSRSWPVAIPERYYPPPERIAAAGLGFVAAQMPGRRFVAEYAVFALLEFLLLALLLWVVHRGSDRRLLGAATVMLLGLPLVRYGYFNDLAMRASIPALFVLQVLAARALGRGHERPLLVALLGLVLAAGALCPANLLRIQAQGVVQRGALVEIRPRERVLDLFRIQIQVAHYFFVGQYLGALDAPFFRYLARRPVPVPRGRP
jgi:hypothetical protein